MGNIMVMSGQEGNHHTALFGTELYSYVLFPKVCGHTLPMRAIIISHSRQLWLHEIITALQQSITLDTVFRLDTPDLSSKS